jgi:hypothetical protein
MHILDAVYSRVLQLAKWLALRADDVGLQSACEEATVCHKAHIASNSSKNQLF